CFCTSSAWANSCSEITPNSSSHAPRGFQGCDAAIAMIPIECGLSEIDPGLYQNDRSMRFMRTIRPCARQSPTPTPDCLSGSGGVHHCVSVAPDVWAVIRRGFRQTTGGC